LTCKPLLFQYIFDIVEVIEKYNLDFDDAYQYVTAEKNSLNNEES